MKYYALKEHFHEKSRVLFASLAGSVIEWYDFYLYGTATGLVFTTLFFPNHDPAISLLLAFVTFGAGYAARPIGSILFGHMGDRIGRKAALMFTLIGMGGSSMLIGVLPTYTGLGWPPRHLGGAEVDSRNFLGR